jgi:hypothetical protein
MKQFLAVLKDSYREARDGWIIYLMIAFAVLLTFLTLSISYRPRTVEEMVNRVPDQFNWYFGLARQPGVTPPQLAIENFQKTDQASEPWKGDYAWDFVVRLSSAKEKEEFAKAAPIPVHQKQFVQQLFKNPKEFSVFNNVEVTEIKDDPVEYRFHVATHGTKVEDVRAWPHDVRILFGVKTYGVIGYTVEEAVYNVEKWGIHKVGSTIALLVGIIITSFFVPNMMRKGAADLLISKPIYRPLLLFYKYIGGMLFMLIPTAVIVVGIWLATGLRSGIWSVGFMWVIPGLVFYFAILYSVSVLMGTLTRSPFVAILVTILVWGIFYGNGVAHGFVEDYRRAEEKLKEDIAKARGTESSDAELPPQMQAPQWLLLTSDVFHSILPRTGDIDDLNSKLIAEGVLSPAELKRKGLADLKYPSWPVVIGVSTAFIAIMLGLACWRFSTRDH